MANSVADPGCLSRIPDTTFFHPGSELFPSRIRIVSIPDPNFFHPGSASKNLSILTRVSDPDPYPDPDPHGSALI